MYEVTVDQRHKYDGGAASYLWINGDNELMETPIIYRNDKIEFGIRDAGLLLPMNVFAHAALTQSYKADPKYQELFFESGLV